MPAQLRPVSGPEPSETARDQAFAALALQPSVDASQIEISYWCLVELAHAADVPDDERRKRIAVLNDARAALTVAGEPAGAAGRSPRVRVPRARAPFWAMAVSLAIVVAVPAVTVALLRRADVADGTLLIAGVGGAIVGLLLARAFWIRVPPVLPHVRLTREQALAQLRLTAEAPPPLRMLSHQYLRRRALLVEDYAGVRALDAAAALLRQDPLNPEPLPGVPAEPMSEPELPVLDAAAADASEQERDSVSTASVTTGGEVIRPAGVAGTNGAMPRIRAWTGAPRVAATPATAAAQDIETRVVPPDETAATDAGEAGSDDFTLPPRVDTLPAFQHAPVPDDVEPIPTPPEVAATPLAPDELGASEREPSAPQSSGERGVALLLRRRSMPLGEVPLENGRVYTIGSARGSDIMLDGHAASDDVPVAAEHARLTVRRGRILFHHVSEQFQSKVNGVVTEWAVIEPDDQIEIGDYLLRCQPGAAGGGGETHPGVRRTKPRRETS